jgi:uncharacterized protein YjbI with pentapeptide repeats
MTVTMTDDPSDQAPQSWTKDRLIAALLEPNRNRSEMVDLRGIVLDDVDLDGILIERVDLSQATLRNVSLRGATLRDVELRGARLDRVLFGVRASGRPTRIESVGFESARLNACALTRAIVHEGRFQGARLEHCDLRYAEFTDSSFKDTTLVGCDFYRSHLGSRTVFERADLSDCSLYLASFEGVTLPRSCIEEGIASGLLQERPDALLALHRRLEASGELDPALGALHREGARLEAAAIYRRLSGLWTSTGAMKDGAWAYRRAKQLETQSCRPDRVLARRRTAAAVRLSSDSPDTSGKDQSLGSAALRWVGGHIADLTAGYGERPLRIAVTAVVWAMLIAVLLLLGGAAPGPRGAMLLAAQAITTTAETAELSPTMRAVVALGAGGGVVLLGLLGFTLGNRLRSA